MHIHPAHTSFTTDSSLLNHEHNWKFYAHFSACKRHNCKQNAWNVEIDSSLDTALPTAAPTRSLISVAAAAVNVIARIFLASTP